MQIKVSDYIAQYLVRAGIHHAFSVVGGGAMHLNDSFGHMQGLEVTYNHHEQACAMAAECYARINNIPALLCVTTGPGGTNAITGVVGGWLDSIPMFVISGQVRTDWTARSSGVNIRSMGDQEFDICRAVDCMTKYCEMITDKNRIRFCLEKAMYICMSGRPGPVWLDIPLDIQSARIDPESLTGFDVEDYRNGGTGWAEKNSVSLIEGDIKGRGENRQQLPPKVSEETAKNIIERIRNSKRPVFNAGNGIRIADAHKEFEEVAQKLGIPVTVGWDSEDCMPVDNPLYVGRPGNFGDRPGNFAIQNSDLVFSVGSRLSLRQVGFNYKTWARFAYTIINDIDDQELKKPTVHISMPVHADAKDLLNVMLKVLRNEKQPVWSDSAAGPALKNMTWLRTCAMWKEKYPVLRPEHLDHSDREPANVYAFVYEIGKRVKENSITVVANGSACVVGGHSYIIKKGQRFISNSAVASMGYGLPAAIGACFANFDRTKYKKTPYENDVILLTGDGSIQMNIQELQTVKHHDLPLKIFLINNDGYQSIRQTQQKFFSDRAYVGIGSDSRDISFPDMEKLSKAYGIPYFRAKHNSELAGAVEKALSEQGPVICEAFVGTDQFFEPKSSGKQLPDGRMVSPPLEDLTPFLSDEEMDANMIVPRIKE